MIDMDIAAMSINRIRLEFKDYNYPGIPYSGKGINRIRLEFKAIPAYFVICFLFRINRIRLEFKAASHTGGSRLWPY